MTKFQPGDIVKIEPEWLDPHEDPNTLYYVIEDLTDEVIPEGQVKVACKAGTSFGWYTYVYSWDMVYKVDPDTLERI